MNPNIMNPYQLPPYVPSELNPFASESGGDTSSPGRLSIDPGLDGACAWGFSIQLSHVLTYKHRIVLQPHGRNLACRRRRCSTGKRESSCRAGRPHPHLNVPTTRLNPAACAIRPSYTIRYAVCSAHPTHPAHPMHLPHAEDADDCRAPRGAAC
jgi:hypothetical protein